MNDQKSYKKEDKLAREPFANTIVSILKNRDRLKRDDDRKSFVLAIDAPWGSGKTFFLQYLAEHLANLNNDPDNQYIPVSYNSWEYDYWDSAFDPFVNNLLQKNFFGNFPTETLQESARNGLLKSIFDISLIREGVRSKKT